MTGDVALPPPVLRSLDLFSGYGGFALALDGIARTVCHVERDAYAAATLVARMEETRLDQAPVWSDVATFDGRPWRGRVEIITGGFPCQPFSVAGTRGGLDDTRWLWPDLERIIGEVRPRFVFLENVRGVVGAGLPAVLHSLAVLGFDAEWGVLAASAVGAPHSRERFWLVAYDDHDGLARQWLRERRLTWSHPHRRGRETVGDPGGERHEQVVGGRTSGEVGDRPDGGHVTQRPGAILADAHGSRPQGRGVRRHEPPERGGDVADTARLDGGEPDDPARPDPRRERARPDARRNRYPPRPDDTDGWLSWNGPQPGVRRGADGSPRWLADALHLGGNGLVPDCAREAWLQLTDRILR